MGTISTTKHQRRAMRRWQQSIRQEETNDRQISVRRDMVAAKHLSQKLRRQQNIHQDDLNIGPTIAKTDDKHMRTHGREASTWINNS
jgi:hypothetical protein